MPRPNPPSSPQTRPPTRPPSQTATTQTRLSRPIVEFDWQEFLPYLAECDAPEAQKREMLETLWRIVVAFVDLGWDVDFKEAAAAAKEKTSGQNSGLRAPLADAMVNLTPSQQETKPHQEKETV